MTLPPPSRPSASLYSERHIIQRTSFRPVKQKSLIDRCWRKAVVRVMSGYATLVALSATTRNGQVIVCWRNAATKVTPGWLMMLTQAGAQREFTRAHCEATP